jgi:hypothetical protein
VVVAWKLMQKVCTFGNQVVSAFGRNKKDFESETHWRCYWSWDSSNWRCWSYGDASVQMRTQRDAERVSVVSELLT